MLTEENKTKILASYLPDGKAFESKNISSKNLYKFLDAIAKSFVLYCNDLKEVLKEMDPSTTEDLISFWEKEYGLPDQCIPIAATLEERRINVLTKIGMNGVQTVQDFIDLAAIFEIDVEIYPGIEYFTFPFEESKFPFPFGTETEARFTLVVKLPQEFGTNVFPFTPTKFPFPFGFKNANILECLFKRLVPANVQVIFFYNL